MPKARKKAPRTRPAKPPKVTRAALVKQLRPLIALERARLRARRKELEAELRLVRRELARCACLPASIAAAQKRVRELERRFAAPAAAKRPSVRPPAPAPAPAAKPRKVVDVVPKLVLYTDGAARHHNHMKFAMRAAKENSKRGGAAWAVHEGGLESSPVVAWFAHGKQVAGPAQRPAPVAPAPAPVMPDWDHQTERGFADRVKAIARALPGAPLGDGRRDPSRVLLRDVFDAGAPWNFPTRGNEWTTFKHWAGFAHETGELRLTRWDMLASPDLQPVRDASELKRHGAAFHFVALD